ncbi:iron chaperone [Rhodohalobacter mucosus]|uniref:Uncharacterized protein n=1 Tax=Rhodohalobacter mucosus TaxID=2079485 RepID=A0A316TUK6_9BACT|nr:hypothetical protein [Rhodohalobacter mucosus]PWN06022.1 hypothetical protein DDZ15_12650 [Rhodohalobacter mucosus]
MKKLFVLPLLFLAALVNARDFEEKPIDEFPELDQFDSVMAFQDYIDEYQQIMMAAYKNFIEFYPFPTTMAVFTDELSDFKQGKGSVQLSPDKPLPRDLIIRMVKFRRDELLKDKARGSF